MNYTIKCWLCSMLLLVPALRGQGSGGAWQALLASARAHAAAKDNDAGLQEAKEALAIAEGAVGASHPDVAETLECMGQLFLQQGQRLPALEVYERALAIRARFQEADPLAKAQVLVNLGRIRRLEHLYRSAWEASHEALDIMERVLGPSDLNLVPVLDELAALYEVAGDVNQVELCQALGLAILEKAHGPGHPDVADTLLAHGRFQRRRGNFAKAGPAFQRALAIRVQHFGPEDRKVATMMLELAKNARGLGKLRLAEDYGARAVAILEKVLGPRAPKVAEALKLQAGILRDGHHLERALLLEQRAAAIRAAAAKPHGRLTPIQEEPLEPQEESKEETP